MKEYDRIDASFYDYYSTGIEGDVEFYVEEARKAGSPVLELACGTGRILIPIAEAGVSITGLDLAPSMLKVARQKISKLTPEIQRRIEILEGDMKNFSLGKKFNLIMIPYRSFLYLLTVEEQKQALACVRSHLSDRGLLILNFFDPKLEILVEHFGSLGSSLKMESEFIHPETGLRVTVWDTRRYNQERQRLDQYFIFEFIDENGKVVDKIYRPLTMRYIFRYEMQHLLELCGFEPEALYGDFKKGPFRHGGEQIWVARRRDQNT